MMSKFFLTVALALALLALLGASPAAAAAPSPLFANVAFPITLSAGYCSGLPVLPPCLSTTVTFNANRTFTSGVGVSGNWSIATVDGQTVLVMASGTCSYEGTLDRAAKAIRGPIVCGGQPAGTLTIFGPVV